MSIDMGRNRLFREFEVLRLRWDQAQLTWQDSVRQDFTESHWNHLNTNVITTLGAMDRLAPILTQLRQDCAGREYI